MAEQDLRLFFGLRLADEVREAVVALQERLRTPGVKVRWVEAANLHFTLGFLGDQPAHTVPALTAVGEQIAATRAPWPLQLQALGAFPKLHRPQTIFVGTATGGEPLAALAADLSARLQERRLAPADPKPFVAHCTIGRVKQERGLSPLADALQAELAFGAGPMTCDCFELLASELTPAGPIYTPLARFELRH